MAKFKRGELVVCVEPIFDLWFGKACVVDWSGDWGVKVDGEISKLRADRFVPVDDFLAEHDDANWSPHVPRLPKVTCDGIADTFTDLQLLEMCPATGVCYESV